MRGVDGGDSDGNREIMGRLSREILRKRVTRNPKQMWQEILNIYKWKSCTFITGMLSCNLT